MLSRLVVLEGLLDRQGIAFLCISCLLYQAEDLLMGGVCSNELG